jgi:hypothetical protein
LKYGKVENNCLAFKGSKLICFRNTISCNFTGNSHEPNDRRIKSAFKLCISQVYFIRYNPQVLAVPRGVPMLISSRKAGNLEISCLVQPITVTSIMVMTHRSRNCGPTVQFERFLICFSKIGLMANSESDNTSRVSHGSYGQLIEIV